MDFDAIFQRVWPWAWPSLAVIAWTLLWVWVLRRTRKWLALREATADVPRKVDAAVDLALRVTFLGAILLGLFLWVLWADFPASVKAFVETRVSAWVMATLLLIAFVVAGVFVVRRVLLFLASRASGTRTIVDDAIIEALHRPLYLTVVLLGVNLWSRLVPIPIALNDYISRGSETFIIILVVLLLDGVVQGLMIARAERSKVLKTSGVVLRTAVRVAFYAIGGLMALSSLGLDVTPILASLGVTSIAIGLALQGTLEDFLAGLLLAADQPIAVGDFIEIEGGQSGVVLSIGWRTTRILTREDMHVIVPNSKLAQTTMLNRSRPREACKFTVRCGVHYASDLDQVARVSIEVAAQLQETDPRAVHGFRPNVVFDGFGDSSVDFAVWLCAKTWEDHFGLQDNFVRSLHRRFDQTGIVIPFPIRTLDVPLGTTVRIERAGGDGRAEPPAVGPPNPVATGGAAPGGALPAPPEPPGPRVRSDRKETR
ncbi:MAG: hypothetical protein CVU56_02685 [Deltaproteobacteria bacterium HGW-Deltaproteobacteria-14]|nr:MAG: hypothetical protein CVU56_02685 [Deltaproteobacteria bacterium HGW-Deltaproteobacteria-14]